MSSIAASSCPVCGGSVPGGAIECPHCGERLIGHADMPANPEQLRNEHAALTADRRRTNALGFALGVPGIALQFVGGFVTGAEIVPEVVGLVVQFVGVLLLISGVYFVTRYKGRNGAWALLGLFGCIGLLVLAVFKDYNKARLKEIEAVLKAADQPVA